MKSKVEDDVVLKNIPEIWDNLNAYEQDHLNSITPEMSLHLFCCFFEVIHSKCGLCRDIMKKVISYENKEYANQIMKAIWS